ncbi:MAG: hypothetical protein JXX14_07935 [Deltaproteobacteria bacterium]|nr:hypothetical protein [Deltaproteobacteria bacterium]
MAGNLSRGSRRVKGIVFALIGAGVHDIGHAKRIPTALGLLPAAIQRHAGLAMTTCSTAIWRRARGCGDSVVVNL